MTHELKYKKVFMNFELNMKRMQKKREETDLGNHGVEKWKQF